MNHLTEVQTQKSPHSLLDVTEPADVPCVNKSKVAHGFDEAAGRYNALAKVQQEIAEYGLARFESLAIPNACCIVDIGCGTAMSTVRLQSVAEHVVGLDISYKMLNQATQDQVINATTTHKQFTAINADAEALPFTSGTIDAVYSSMALQWCESPHAALREVDRVLAPNGKALLCILTGESFATMQAAWRHLALPSRINMFKPKQAWLDAAKELGLKYEATHESFISYHSGVLDMLRSIKLIGANTQISGSQLTKNYFSKYEIRGLTQYVTAYQLEDKRIPLCYELLFLTIEK